MKLIAFAASNSSTSINAELVRYATTLVPNADVELLNLNDYEIALFSEDREKALGQPEQAHAFRRKLGSADALLIGFAEHNGSYTAAYKNLFDWTSRIDPKVFQGKPMVLLATSPGPGGGKNVLATAVTSAPYFGGEVVASLSLPKFYENFDQTKSSLLDEEKMAELIAAMDALSKRAQSLIGESP